MASVKPSRAEWLQAPGDQQGLKRYLQTLRERLWLIVATVLVATAAAIAYVVTADEVYQAEADILVTPMADATGALSSVGLIRESNDPLRLVQTAAELIESRDAAQIAARDLGRDADAILAKIDAEPVAESNIVTITAEGPSPEAAAALANAYAEAAIEHRTEVIHERIDAELPILRERLDQLSPGPARDSLAAEVALLETLRAGSDPTLGLEEAAVEPAAPVSPRRTASIAAGVIAGLILGIGGAFALQVLDPRLRREDQLRERYRLPVLARIPRERSRSDQPLPWGSLSSASVEAYRTLRAILGGRHARDQAASSSVLVTSPGPSEGKTTTAINLATSLALAGNRVILIEADLRRPSIAKALDTPVDRGVVSVLLGQTTLEESLVTSSYSDPNLRLLLAEHEGLVMGELFSLPGAQRLVADAKLLADFVVVDSPPLATVVDALPLARTVDDVLVVVRLGGSRLNRIQELAELLADTGIKPAGFALIGVPRGRDAYYGDYRRRRLAHEDREPLAMRSG